MRTISLVLLTLVAALGASAPAQAQVMLDMSKVTCWQYVTYKVTNPKYISVWISGYYHGKRGDMLVDMAQVVENADKLTTFCTKNPDMPLMQAVEEALGDKN
jgi:acid stress chaperone HdeB